MKKLVLLILIILSAYFLVCVLGYLGLVTSRTNLIGWFLLLTAIAFAIGGPYLLRDNLREVASIRKEHQDRSFWGILPGFLLVFYGAPLEWLFIPPIFPGLRGAGSQIIGLSLITIGIILFTWSRLTLKELYSGRIRVLAKHRLVQNGPYHIVRHPAYASYLLMSVGIGIGYSSLIGVLSVFLLLFPGMVYRIKIEERLLFLEFGEEYSTYIQRTRYLIPFIW